MYVLLCLIAGFDALFIGEHMLEDMRFIMGGNTPGGAEASWHQRIFLDVDAGRPHTYRYEFKEVPGEETMLSYVNQDPLVTFTEGPSPSPPSPSPGAPPAPTNGAAARAGVPQGMVAPFVIAAVAALLLLVAL
jgi:hypothetical protein